MKIHIDASRALDPHPTGVNVYAKEIIDHLVAGTSNGDEFILYAPTWLADRKAHVFSTEMKHVTWRFLNWPPKFFWTQVRLAWSWMLADKNNAVFFAPAHVAPFFAPRNLVVTIHDIAFEFLTEAFSWHERIFARVMTRLNTSVAKKILVPSDETREQLIARLKISPDKIVVTPFALPCFIKRHESDARPPARPPFILSVGRIEYKKGTDILIHAFEQLRLRGREIELVLVGKPGVGFEQINTCIQSSPYKKYIHVLGFTSEETLRGLYGAARALALPTRYEGFGFNFLEGMARGVPVVGIARGSVREVAGDGAALAENEHEFIDLLDRTISDEVFRADIIAQGTRHVLQFSWTRTANMTKNALLYPLI